MKKYFKLKIVAILILAVSSSCEDYLDQAPETELGVEDAFRTFQNAQGFVEEMYAMVVDYSTAGHTFQDYIYGDDAYHPEDWKSSGNIDRGNLGFWVDHSLGYLGGAYRTPRPNERLPVTDEDEARFRPRVWDASMFGIRKANIALSSEELMVGLSQPEKDIILGQAYFFRAYFHAQIMKFWGRFPHITEVFVGAIDIPRPETYKEVALAINEDYKRAAELLPVDWNTHPAGQQTLGENRIRITKGAAYAMQGKNLLLAASPLMNFNNQPGINTYQYDTELADMAVDAFAEVLKLVDSGVYGLSTFENYEEVFWRTELQDLYPGGKELIMTAPGGRVIWHQRFMSTGVPRSVNRISGSAMNAPTHNFIHNNFGMANGLSIEDDQNLTNNDPRKLYDENDPFANRDPRFYKWIIIDGESTGSLATIPQEHRKFEFFLGGEHRVRSAAVAGYGYKKFYPIVDGNYHSNQWNNIIRQYTGQRLVMRLTDVYLMYAEALHASRGATVAPSSYPLTAEQAINKLRDRAGVPPVDPSIVGDNNRFMDELRRERAVELSYEGHRWVDIRRWGVAHLDKYRIKTALEFDEGKTFFRETLLVDRVCEYPKHYWLPFEANQTQFYEGFPQNPEW